MAAMFSHVDQRFGRLLVLRQVKCPTKRQLVWLCRCDCGTTKSIRGGDLRSGRISSCGCRNKEVATERWRKRRPKWVGKRLGLITVIREAGKNQRGRFTWECHCDCGSIVYWENCQLTRKSKSCGCVLTDYARGPEHGNWKGGRAVRTDGYVLIRRPDHPNAQKRGYVLEHVWVMSQHLDRPIRPTEQVHHKNGIRADNQLSNLELWVKSHPAGQRPKDLVEYAKAILRDYETEVSAQS